MVRHPHRRPAALACLVLALFAPRAAAAGEAAAPIAIRAAKVLTASRTGPQSIDHGVVVLRDGKIEAVGPARSTPIPADCEVIDVGERWVMPGMVELHCHVGGNSVFITNDLNDTVYLTNPGLRASAGVIPGNDLLARGLAGGVTTVLHIPGSGSNMGGQGVLLKTGQGTFEDIVVRNPGSLKLAQAGNPEGFTVGVGRSFMNWNTRNTFKRGLAYAKRWEAFESGKGPRPERDLQWEVFRDLAAKKTQVSTHTQVYQVVLMTITMVRMELGLDVYIDHGSFDGFRTAALAEEQGVPAILGPRELCPPLPPFLDTDGRLLGMAAEYQARGHTMIGFNTDCIALGGFTPGQEELCVQAGMSVRYGLDDANMEGVRGLTIVPALAAGLGDRVGSLEPGKDADVLVVTGDPCDPRSSVEAAWVDGKPMYDADRRRVW